MATHNTAGAHHKIFLAKGEVEQPAEDERAADQGQEQPACEALGRHPVIAMERGKHGRDKGREQDHQAQVAGHVFASFGASLGGATLRPRATSAASNITRTLSSPETMRNVLPYSYEAATTSPPPDPAHPASTRVAPIIHCEPAASRTSGSPPRNSNSRPPIARPQIYIGSNAAPNTSALPDCPCRKWPAPGNSHASATVSPAPGRANAGIADLLMGFLG